MTPAEWFFAATLTTIAVGWALLAFYEWAGDRVAEAVDRALADEAEAVRQGDEDFDGSAFIVFPEPTLAEGLARYGEPEGKR